MKEINVYKNDKFLNDSMSYINLINIINKECHFPILKCISILDFKTSDIIKVEYEDKLIFKGHCLKIDNLNGINISYFMSYGSNSSESFKGFTFYNKDNITQKMEEEGKLLHLNNVTGEIGFLKSRNTHNLDGNKILGNPGITISKLWDPIRKVIVDVCHKHNYSKYYEIDVGKIIGDIKTLTPESIVSNFPKAGNEFSGYEVISSKVIKTSKKSVLIDGDINISYKLKLNLILGFKKNIKFKDNYQFIIGDGKTEKYVKMKFNIHGKDQCFISESGVKKFLYSSVKNSSYFLNYQKRCIRYDFSVLFDEGHNLMVGDYIILPNGDKCEISKLSHDISFENKITKISGMNVFTNDVTSKNINIKKLSKDESYSENKVTFSIENGFVNQVKQAKKREKIHNTKIHLKLPNLNVGKVNERVFEVNNGKY